MIWLDQTRRLAQLAAGLLILAGVGTAHAEEDTVSACLSAHTRGQELKRDGLLLESREALRECSASQCPNALIRDCSEWLQQLDRQIPSVSVRVTADGASRVDASLVIDDAPPTGIVSGKAIELNPGKHRLQVLLSPYEPFETVLVVSEGDQFRVIDVEFHTRRPTPGAESTPASPEPTMHRPTPILTYVFAGVTAAAAISGTGWGLSSWSLRKELETACAPACSPESIDLVKQRAQLADISWAIGGASLIATVTSYLLRPEVPVEDSGVQVGVNVLRGGAVGTVSVAGF